jgi:hypothetical protein
MPKPVTDDMRDPRTPDSVIIRAEARRPQLDPTCGVARAAAAPAGMPRNRLVTIGDSLTQGFQSGAILHTEISWPRIVAWEMGWDRRFRYPVYRDPNGGMPLNLEVLVRKLERHFGDTLDWYEAPGVAAEVLGTLASLDAWWNDQWNRSASDTSGIFHNLAVWGWDLRDCLGRTAANLATLIERNGDSYWRNVNARSGWRVLASARDAQNQALNVFQAAAQLGLEGTSTDPNGPGIETLVVVLGANNALGSVVRLGRPQWSGPGFDNLEEKQKYTVWQPPHFEVELARVVDAVRAIGAHNVMIATVPHVTIAPIARGVSDEKWARGSRYFPYYTRPWIEAADFDPRDDNHITSAEARAIDSCIDQYNDAIETVVQEQRRTNPRQNWYLLEIAGLLDRLASRRYIEDPEAQPSWWRDVGGRYPLPRELAQLEPAPDSKFFASGPQGRTAGGLFSLDGIHPTTIAYGLLAQEVMNVMHAAGVKFYFGDDESHVRPGPVQVDFEHWLELDSLVRVPPRSLTNSVRTLRLLDQRIDQFLRVFGAHVDLP